MTDTQKIPQTQLSALWQTLKTNGNANKRELIIVDVDGTLVFNEEARRQADIEVFGRPLTKGEFDEMPRVIKGRAHELVATKYRHVLGHNVPLVKAINGRREKAVVVVLTGRATSVEDETRQTLAEIGLHYDLLLTNPNPETVDHKDFKQAMLSELAKGFDWIEVYDDREDVIDRLKRHSSIMTKFYIVRPEGMLRLGEGHRLA